MITVALIGGVERKLGCWARLHKPGEIYPIFGSRGQTRLIPRSQWQEADWGHHVDWVLDQGNTGACNAFAAVQCVHVLRRMAGLPPVRLSPGNLYGRINGGTDGGSTLVDSIRELERRGVCRAELVPELEWRPSRWPPGWEEDAKKFRVLEAWDCPTFDHMASAILLGFPVNLGILIGSNFIPGPDGWVPARSGAVGGHAMCGVGLLRKGSTWGIKVVNSWGKDWGIGGFAVIPESYFGRTMWTDGWTIRVAVDPEGAE